MGVAIITGAAGLVGSEAVKFFSGLGMSVVGIDNGMRKQFFGEEASTDWQRERLVRELPSYRHFDLDIRDFEGVSKVFRGYGREIGLVVHAAAQPSHDWAARDPFTDFTINANGTSALLEATRLFAPDAPFIFTSTNKVYGDRPNYLPLLEMETRWEPDPSHPYSLKGIPESMSVDATKHSLFGASKVAADILVQEYGRYFGMKTACFRGGCLTGPNHSGTQLHGFLAYLAKCVTLGKPYTIFGYKGKQVRDNIHSHDLIRAFHEFYKNPRSAEVYNIGGGRYSNCSMLEAIAICEATTGKEFTPAYVDEPRSGDHMWWVSDTSRFEDHYPSWSLEYDVPRITREICECNAEKWSQE